MRKIIIITVCAMLAMVISAQESNSSSESWFERDLTLFFDGHIGTNYASIFGSRISKNMGFFSLVDVSHKSGFGVGFYRMDDFSKETTGRIGFVDLYWAGSLTENISVYAAGEYGWWDNWKEGRFFSPYGILSYQLKSWNIAATPIFIWYDRLPEGNRQFILKMEVSKQLFKGTSARLAGWYDNQNPDKFHFAAGVTQSLPANTYLALDGVWKPGDMGEKFLSIGVGVRFRSK